MENPSLTLFPTFTVLHLVPDYPIDDSKLNNAGVYPFITGGRNRSLELTRADYT